jgi:hypothetical protein
MEISQMKKWPKAQHVAWLVGIAVAWMSVPAFAQSGSVRPLQRAIEEHLELLMSGSFDALERAASEARRTKAKISDGQPKLQTIYAGTAGDSSPPLTDDLWKVRRSRLEQWRAAYPASVTAKVALASFPLRYGWFARGSGYAGTVSQEGWTLMRQRVEESRVALEALDAAAKKDPGWADAMLDIARIQHWPSERFDALYEAAAAQDPDYLSYHFAYLTYYSTRWYGSPEQQRNAIEKVVERTRPMMGETMYARLNWGLGSSDMFMSGRTDWTRMKAGFERMTKDYPDEWNINHFARFACMADDWPTVARLTAMIGDKPVLDAWLRNMDFYEHCRQTSRQAAPR